ncbi:hypothetical protein EAI_09372 [Harpegnathos saltator]|uniref:Uncharacterized protein n=1 Tax=Harpegnathos saltator TaxID=610380 RepID=E2BRY4_HARSA|nr:hypothetical protein EAI_09372 [Harpegnathos saltator]
MCSFLIEAVAKEFPTINVTIFGRKAGPWLAQATFRIKKQNSKKEEAANDEPQNSSFNEDEGESTYDESSEDGDRRLQ